MTRRPDRGRYILVLYACFIFLSISSLNNYSLIIIHFSVPAEQCLFLGRKKGESWVANSMFATQPGPFRNSDDVTRRQDCSLFARTNRVTESENNARIR